MYVPCVLLPVKRIIAIGDLHGDYKATLLALKKANLIDDHHNWIGDDTIVVQLGDIVDRGSRLSKYAEMCDEDSELKIMNLMEKLNKQAKLKNGAIYCLLGNHEVMNVLGDFSYTSKKGLLHFGGKKGRYEYFKSGGKIAQKMAKTRNVIMRIGDWIFVHGGVTPNIAKKYKIVEINDLMRRYLNGEKKLENDKRFRELFLNQGSILWTRKYSEENVNQKDLDKTLEYLGGKHLVVGHTPQDKINSRCKGKIWRIDTGMSDAFGKKKADERIEVLEIINNGEKVSILK